MQMVSPRSKNSSSPPSPVDKPKRSDKPMKASDEPNAVNRLLMSDVTMSWSRTFRALLMLMGLVVLACAGMIAIIIMGSSLAGFLPHSVGVGP